MSLLSFSIREVLIEIPKESYDIRIGSNLSSSGVWYRVPDVTSTIGYRAVFIVFGNCTKSIKFTREENTLRTMVKFYN